MQHLTEVPNSSRQARGPVRCVAGYGTGHGPMSAKFCEEVTAFLLGSRIQEVEIIMLEQKTPMKEGSSGYHWFINKNENYCLPPSFA